MISEFCLLFTVFFSSLHFQSTVAVIVLGTDPFYNVLLSIYYEHKNTHKISSVYLLSP